MATKLEFLSFEPEFLGRRRIGGGKVKIDGFSLTNIGDRKLAAGQASIQVILDYQLASGAARSVVGAMIEAPRLNPDESFGDLRRGIALPEDAGPADLTSWR